MSPEEKATLCSARALIKHWAETFGPRAQLSPYAQHLKDATETLRLSEGVEPGAIPAGSIFQFAFSSDVSDDRRGKTFFLLQPPASRARFYTSPPGASDAGQVQSFHSFDRIYPVKGHDD